MGPEARRWSHFGDEGRASGLARHATT